MMPTFGAAGKNDTAGPIIAGRGAICFDGANALSGRARIGNGRTATVVLRLIHVGMGGWGRDWEVNAIPRVKEVQRVACVDADAPTLALAKEKLDLPDDVCFTSLDEALATVEADAVLVTVPIEGHAPVSVAALDA